jgi:hypothetical protein
VHPRRLLALTFALFLLAGCGGGGRGMAPPRGGPGGTAPASTVERFLRLAAAKEYGQMGYVFGTAQGSIAQRDAAPTVERRMFALATILEHDRFAIREEQPIPGRTGQAVQVNVQLTRGRQARTVPFVVVRGGDRWYVEQVDLEKVTR